MNLIAIAAIGKNRELGKDNQLIWHFPADLKFFRQQTSGHPIVMGKNTWLSLPKKLPGRKHVIISSTIEPMEDVDVFKNIPAFLEYYRKYDGDVYVIGGGMLYQSMLPYCYKLILTEIQASYEADVFFPEFDSSLYERKVLGQMQENETDYAWVEYVKK